MFVCLESPKEEGIADKGKNKRDPVGKYISVIINIVKLKIASSLDFYTEWKLKRKPYWNLKFKFQA